MRQIVCRGTCYSAWIGGAAVAVLIIVGSASLSHALQPNRRGIGTDPYSANGTSTNLESYAKLYLGATFAGRFDNIVGTSSATGFSESRLGVTSSALYGGKLGVFPWRWFGFEVEAFSSTPHTKAQAETFSNRLGSATGAIPGTSDRVTVLAFNTIVRYPGQLLQPYVGIGPGIFFVTAKNESSNSDTALGLNVLAGLNVRIADQLGVFIEYKYDRARLNFDHVATVASPIFNVGLEGTYHSSAIVVGVGYHF